MKVKEVKQELIEAMDLLNETGLINNNLFYEEKLSYKENVECFLTAVESIPYQKESEIPEEIVNLYNRLVDEIDEIVEEQKEQKSEQKVKKTEGEEKSKDNKKKDIKVKEENKDKGKKTTISAFGFLKTKIDKMPYESLINDPELLEKYKNNKAWLKSDIKRVMEINLIKKITSASNDAEILKSIHEFKKNYGK